MVYHCNICGSPSDGDGKIQVFFFCDLYALSNGKDLPTFLEQRIAAIFRVDYHTLKKEAIRFSQNRSGAHGAAPHKISIFNNFLNYRLTVQK